MTRVILLFPLFTLIYFFDNHVIAEYTDIVETDIGKVRGNILETVQLKQQYSSFKGIPYAEPPIGYGRRFRRPVPAKPWKGVLDATKDQSPCAQWDFAWKASDRHIGGEDCLYLNVHTPELNFTNPGSRAVMVYIHGGAFLWGSINSAKYGPDFLIEKDVVVVLIQYRLGVFGFLTLGSLEVDANNGLRDQVEALRWVQRNIRKFGGDPDKVTIVGDGAGGASVEYHKLSPQSRDLFRASIAMSGSALNDWSYYKREHSDEIGLNFIRRFVREWSDYKDLYRKMIDIDMNAMLTNEYIDWLLDSKVPYRPSDDYLSAGRGNHNTYPFITLLPLSAYKMDKYTPKHHMLGFMKNEGISVAATISIATDSMFSSIVQAMSSTITNFYIIQGIDLTQRLLTLSDDQPIFYYQNSFDYDQALHKVGAISNNKQGAGHGDDIAHIFWMRNEQQSLDPNSNIGRHRQKMVTMWTNFAKYLKPILDDENDPILGNAKWERSNRTGGYLDINRDLVFHANSRPINDFIDGENSATMDLFKNENNSNINKE